MGWGMWRIYRPDIIPAWKHPETKKRLSWYYQVALNQKPAKYLICKHISAETNPFRLGEEELWALHKDLKQKFSNALEEVEKGSLSFNELEKSEHSFLDVKVALVKHMITHCNFCERRCGVNREKGERGFCRQTSQTYVSSWFHHFGEEAPLVSVPGLSGQGGSGTIFFISCNFRCVFCQNYTISQEYERYGEGDPVDPQMLAKIATILRKEGAPNINYVGGDPTPSAHTIIESLRYMDVNTPLLWNSNMYCSQELMEILVDLIDIWLPDFKYFSDECAQKLSSAPNYFQIVSRNHLMAHQHGDIIVRHLVLPNHLDCCTIPLLNWIAKNLPRALVNIMQQYRPEYLVARYPNRYKEIARRPTRAEMERAYAEAQKLGIVYEPVS